MLLIHISHVKLMYRHSDAVACLRYQSHLQAANESAILDIEEDEDEAKKDNASEVSAGNAKEG